VVASAIVYVVNLSLQVEYGVVIAWEEGDGNAGDGLLKIEGVEIAPGEALAATEEDAIGAWMAVI
jgi:hypothetical protein